MGSWSLKRTFALFGLRIEFSGTMDVVSSEGCCCCWSRVAAGVSRGGCCRRAAGVGVVEVVSAAVRVLL